MPAPVDQMETEWKSRGASDEELPHTDWETSLVANEARSRQVAWWVAASATVVALCEALALVVVTPLHTVVPYVVTVDRVTGDAEVTPTAGHPVSAADLGDKYWVSQFVIARQRYVFRLLQHDYDTVRRFSDAAVWTRYAALFDGDGALDRRLADQTEIVPSISSVTLNEPGIATVRLDVETKSNNGENHHQRYIATVRYDYQLPLHARESELISNPFGFRVLGYQLDEELGSNP